MTDTRPPLWLLDVDGVLNAVTGKPDRTVWPDWSSGTATAEGRSWPIWFSPTVAGTVARLHTDGLADVRWLTSWGHDANGPLRRLLGLPALRVAGTADEQALRDAAAAASVRAHADLGTAAADPLTGRWWKFDIVRALHAADPTRRILWTDDDLRFETRINAWMSTHTHSLLIAPRSQLGITPKLLRQIREFCDDPTLTA